MKIIDLLENFADGKKPGRKGLAKRSGVNCKQSVSKLRNIAKHSTGEKQRMAHWCANMKSGKKKTNESIIEGDIVNINNKPITIKNAKYLGDSRWRLWFNDKKGYYVLHITLYQKDDAGTGWRPADWNINGEPGANVLVKNRTPKWYSLCKHIDDYMVEHHYEEMQQAAKEQLDRPSDPSEWGDPVYITTDEPEPDDTDPPKPKKPSLRIVK